MRAVDVIVEKRDGGELSRQEIDFFITGYTRGEIPDYQAAAWAMAVLLQGMTHRETIDLTLSMAASGQTLDLHDVAPVIVDKHSTGGVGDKTTIAVAPWVAACGLPVGKMSGRGLGFSGGTLDKLESIPGFHTSLSIQAFKQQIRDVGVVVAGQTQELAPADGKLYALRDVTGTVPSLPLIASSIMSKKIAAGADAIALDVKVGRGAFMKTLEEATALAEIMVEIGKGAGRRMSAVVANMSQPLGRAVGNALEVVEAVDTLDGRGPPDFLEHCLTVAQQMLLLGGRATDADAARSMLAEAMESGHACDKLVQWIEAQGGKGSDLERLGQINAARVVRDVVAPRSGVLAGVDAMEVGLAAMDLGAGRLKKGDPIDHAVGVLVEAKVGQQVSAGDVLFVVYANDQESYDGARERLLEACTWADGEVGVPPLVYRIIG